MRRIQLVGQGTYIVALPKSWVIERKLSKGSLVKIKTLPSGELLVEPFRESSRRDEKTAVVELTRNNYETALRSIISYYIAGASLIEIRYSLELDKRVAQLIDQLRRILLGVEVLEVEPGAIKLYAVLDDYAVDFWEAYSKMRRGVVSMIEDLELVVEEGNRKLAGLIVERDDIVDRLYLYLVRQLTKSLLEGRASSVIGLATPAEAPHVFLAIKSLERIGDHITIIASLVYSEALSPVELRDYLDKIKETKTYVVQATRLLREPEADKADRLIGSVSKLRRELSIIRDLATGKQITQAISSLVRINSYTQDILEVIIDVTKIRT